MAVELLLNLCWLTLALPAFLLWRRRDSCEARGSAIFICTLGCVLVLLFPVISASDDLHSGAQAIEDCKRNLNHGGHGARDVQPVADLSQSALPVISGVQFVFTREAAVLAFSPHSFETPLAPSWTNRAPPA